MFKMTLPPQFSVRPLALTLAGFACLAAGSAQAETSPYYIGVSQRFSHNSNVFLNTDALAKSDTISSTGVRLGLDQPISRQRLTATLSANANRYSKLSTLNNTDYALDTRLAAQPSLTTDLAGHAGDLGGEGGELVHHGVDGLL